MDKIIYFLIGLVIGLFVVFKPVERLYPPKDIINDPNKCLDIKDNLEQIDSLKRLNKTDSLKAELNKRDELIINQNKALQELKKAKTSKDTILIYKSVTELQTEQIRQDTQALREWEKIADLKDVIIFKQEAVINKQQEIIIKQDKQIKKLKKQNKILKIILTAGIITVVGLVAGK